ncbi:ion transporter [Microbulbifer agarilyticus]|uniref:ion transporter n=1 Tax=Microbulbifer agarilyticus TaxID=260552 RepID=UPI001C96CBA3|nr:ion transporter [Microbulbifer agarilyticus]MBY6189502.1 ion transporter [Microbulbifer agarilyticus]MBY6210774.1 ion transporter [Microbulbifer agarilyticus]
MALTGTRKRLNEIIFGTDSPAGKNFDVFLIWAILLSVALVLFASVESLWVRFGETFYVLEWFFTGLFTVEYLARIYCARDRREYVTSFYGIVDLLAILPSYLALIFTGATYLMVIRLLRVLRIFRVLKLVRYLRDANLLVRSLWQARRRILVFYTSVLVICIIFGSVMFIVEGPRHGFTSIPKSIYWTIVTITTVGYGDITPHTPLGQAIAAMTMLIGYSIIAVPTGIVTAELAHELGREKQLARCHNCGKSGHDADAEYCKQCGYRLEDFEEPVDEES